MFVSVQPLSGQIARFILCHKRLRACQLSTLCIFLFGVIPHKLRAYDNCGGCPNGETCKLTNVGWNQGWRCVAPKTPPVSIPSSPAGLTATCPEPGIVATVSWAPVAGATAYALRVDDLSNGWMNSCAVTQNAGDICLDNVTTPSYRFVTLPGHTYNWWVHALNSAGWSAAGGYRPF